MHIKPRTLLTALLLAVISLPAPGRDVRASVVQRFVIASGGAASGACPQSAPCTLAYALSTASAGDELILAWGGYSGSGAEVVYVDKSLTIRGGWDGAASGPVVIDTSIFDTELFGGNARRVVRAVLDAETLTMQDLTISGGATTESNGAGMYITSSSSGTVNLVRVEVSANGSASNPAYGGGIYAAYVTLNITDSLLSFNAAQYGGGGLKTYQSNLHVVDSRFEQNSSSYGSVLEVENPSSIDIARSVFVRNHGPAYGEASVILVSDNDPALTLTNNFMIHNTGTLIDGMGGTLNVRHNTFAADGSGTGLQLASGVSGSMQNNIFTGLTHSIVLSLGTPGFTIDHTLFYANDHDDALGTNSVAGNPCFIDPVSDEAGFHLNACSAAIDAGVSAGVTEDFDGGLRPLLQGYDIGADEFGWTLFMPLVLR